MNTIKFFSVMFAFVVASLGTSVQAQDAMAKKMSMKHDNVTVIELAQVDGAFETEGLNLKPGKYQFKVTNKTVDHEVGFVIQKAEDKDGDIMKTAVENSFAKKMIKKGETQESGIVELKAGEYVYSCPMNPTPKYTIKVQK